MCFELISLATWVPIEHEYLIYQYMSWAQSLSCSIKNNIDNNTKITIKTIHTLPMARISHMLSLHIV